MTLPPLTALTYFNEAARHTSFKMAANALNVTEGAISRQIKRLEEHFDIPLFVRVHRGVQLTPAGLKLHTAADAALRQIAKAADDLRQTSRAFTLSVTTSFAIRWLMRRLALFETAHPAFPINLQTTKDPREFASGSFDASILYCLGNPLDPATQVPLGATRIMTEWLLPVCAPSLLTGHQPLTPTDLSQYKLIFNEPTGRDWKSWLSGTKGAAAHLDTALKFEHDDTAIQAAVAGHGIALANLAYIENELNMGSLVPASTAPALPIGAHYIVSPPGTVASPAVKAFREWLLALAADDPSQKHSEVHR